MKNRDSAGKVAFAASQYGKEKEYWLNKFSGELKKSSFPYDHFPSELDNGEADFVNFNFSRETSSELTKLSKEMDHRLYMILATGVAALLYRYTGNSDIIIGSPIFKQEREGEYINTVLPLRIQVDERVTFKELLLQGVRSAVTEATEHQNYPIETLLFQLDMPVTGWEFPLFDVVILLGNIQYKKYIRHVHPNIIFSFLRTDDGGINGELEYNTRLYDTATVERIVRHFKCLVERAIIDLDIPVAGIDMLSEQEKEQLLVEFNGPRTMYPGQSSIGRLFEEQVARVPDAIALTYEAEFFTYSRLNEEADRLASFLRMKGLTRGEPAALMVENSPRAVISILAILKAGGGYLPLNVEYPDERKKYMLDDSNVALLLTNCKEASVFQAALTLIDLDNRAIYEHEPTANSSCDLHGGDLAYIMYTSGSTGTPKGVLVEHGNVIRLVKNTNFVRFEKGDSLLLTGALEFDASTFEIWGPLLNGLTLHLVNKDTILSPDKLKEAVRKNSVTTMWMTSPLFNQLSDADIEIFAGIRNLLVGGDVLSPSHIFRLKKRFPHVNVIDGYGPTENTTFSTTFLVENEFRENIPIGKPIANSTVYILDDLYSPVPIGVPGELHVGGDGLSRGYLNNPELTAEKFIFNRSYRPDKTYILYKTGDLARWLRDGNIEFMGRRDFQVKIRGYRIEPGEIEKRLKQLDFIKEAVVIDRKNNDNEKYLCGYLVLMEEKSEKFDAVELKKTLSLNLPDYMVPAHFVQLEKIPLTSNGKVDRKALPEPEITGWGTTYTAPRDSVEEKFIEIWSDVLRIEKEKISIDSNFFELGGHSLKATILISKLNKAFDVKVPLAELFKIPTIRELGEFIKKLGKEAFSSIEPAEEKEYYELSAAQKRHYFLQHLEPDSTVYNVPLTTVLKGKVNSLSIEKVFEKLIKRHGSIRTSFHMINEKPVQQIHVEVEFEIEILGGRDQELSISRDDAALSAWPSDLIKNFIRPFDLSKAPLMRVGLLKIAEEEFILVVDMHHIITDGTSMGLLVDEFSQFYEGKELPALRLQYKDYSEWQNSDKEKKNLKRQEKYWLQEFEEEIPLLALPTDYPRPLVQSFEGDNVSFEILPDEADALKSLALFENSTLFMVLLTIYNVLLSRLSGQEDIVIGTPVAGRRHVDLEKIVGMFVNTLGLRCFSTGEKTFQELLKEVKKRTLEAFENQDYQFEDLVELVMVNRDVSRNPIFDVMFVFQNFTISPGEGFRDGMVGKPIQGSDVPDNILQTSKFDLILTTVENDRGLLCLFQFCTKLFKKETIERFIIYFKKIVSTIVKEPRIRLHEIEIISEEEKQRILFEFNYSQEGYPNDKGIYGLFEEQVVRTPDGIALFVYMSYRSYGSYITYSELNEKSGYLAYLLMQKGVQSGDIVGLMAERSPEMIAGILGIWKAGCAYAPLNPKAPVARNEYILAECGARFLLTSSNLRRNFEYLMVLDFKHLNLGIVSCLEFRAPNLSPSNLAYIIFTSGSTGNPKGVLITHANLSPLLHWGYRHLGIGIHDRALQNLSYYFDWSIWEMFIVLTSGASLCIVPEDILLDATAGGDFTNRWGITILHVTPTQYHYMVKSPTAAMTLKYLFIGAEKLTYDLVERSFASVSSTCRVFNMYGPTEATIISAVLEIHRESLSQFKSLTSIPIGKSAGNTIHLILDKYNNVCPINVAGELYIGGDGVSRGYLNNPELTADKFNKSYKAYKTYIFYKTGDLARWLWDGNIEYLGRIDEQVKIRGFRIELGEIENRLVHCPGIKEAVILVKEDENNDKCLIAYFVANVAGNIVPTAELKQYLARHLPDYMVPSYFIQIERIPLNPSGKIDRKALPEPVVAAGGVHTSPQNEIEEKLLDIWLGILGMPKDLLGVGSNFFHVGGHSLNATVMAARIHKTFNVKIPVMEIFKNPTIRELSAYIQGVREERYASIEPVEKKDYYVSSPAQKRLYILQQMELESVVYNMPQVFYLSGALDSEKLEVTFRKLIQRHESLRTSFHMLGRDPVQKIHDTPGFEIEYYDLAAKNAKEREEEKLHHSSFMNTPNHFIHAFDLSKAPLVRVGLIKEAETRHVLVVDMHHIISDGVSNGILVRDFFALYNGDQLEPVRIQYKDFSEWQFGEKERIKKQEAYWLEVFEGEVPVLNIFTDYPRPAVQSFEGRSFAFELPMDVTAALKSIVAARGVTLYMILLAVYNVLLARLTGQEDIVIGTPTAGRRHADLEKTIGMFVNTLALRNYPEGQMEFGEFLSELKKSTLEAFENQEYQFEDLVEKVLLNRDVSRNPIFDTMFSLQNLETSDIELPRVDSSQLEVIPDEVETGIAKFDLILTCTEGEEKLDCSFTYCTRLFKEKTMLRFTAYFKQVVSVIIENAHKKISAVEIITELEKQQLLYEFNDTVSGFSSDKTLHRLFEEQAVRTPDYTAVICDDHRITYSRLNERANQLAWLLKKKGIGTGGFVGVVIDRTVEMVTAVMGIIKAGAAYVPQEPDLPEARIRRIMASLNVKGIITNRQRLEKISEIAKKLDYLTHTVSLDKDAEAEEIFDQPVSNVVSEVNPGDTAYVIHTSGSTGTPKGVVERHRPVVNVVEWVNRMFRVGPPDKLLCVASLGFDLSVYDIFGILASGAAIRVVPGANTKDPHWLLDAIYKEGVTFWDSAPAALLQLAPFFQLSGNRKNKSCFRLVFLSGDWIPVTLPDRLRESFEGISVIALGGATEATIWSNYFPVGKVDPGWPSIPYGKPIRNAAYYILDRFLHPCPVGVPGDLFIGGQCLASGYINDVELTAYKFIDNPFVKGEKIYRTGDMARWFEDGNMEFLGRKDFQVKIRGQRIELGEIENQLLKHEDIETAIVVTKDTGTMNTPGSGKVDKYLCAYYVSGKELDGAHLKTFLSRELPDYMIPSYFVRISRIPLSPSGKLDQRALPDPGVDAKTKGEYTAPRNEIEHKLVELWSEILGQASIGIDANFFEIGGHSLKATAMLARIYEMFHVRVPLTEIFLKPSIHHLAEFIANMEKESFGIADPYVVLLRKKSVEANHLFLVHDGSGEVEGYVEFCQQLPVHVDLNIWGLRTGIINHENCSPRNITIEELAENCIEKIKKVQPKGPYFIGGWSLGGVIAFEMALQLETSGDDVAFLGLIDAPTPWAEETKEMSEFSLNTEFNWVWEYLPDNEIKERLRNVTDLDEIWPTLLSYLQENNHGVERVKRLIPDALAQMIPNFRQVGIVELIYYLNLNRTLTRALAAYIPRHEIQAQIRYFKAGQTPGRHLENWKGYCARPIISNEIPGDHFSILRTPGVESTGKIFGSLL